MEGGVLARPIGPAKRGTSSFALSDEKRGLKSFFPSLFCRVGRSGPPPFLGLGWGLGAGRRGALEQKLVTGNGGEGGKERKEANLEIGGGKRGGGRKSFFVSFSGVFPHPIFHHQKPADQADSCGGEKRGASGEGKP